MTDQLDRYAPALAIAGALLGVLLYGHAQADSPYNGTASRGGNRQCSVGTERAATILHGGKYRRGVSDSACCKWVSSAEPALGYGLSASAIDRQDNGIGVTPGRTGQAGSNPASPPTSALNAPPVHGASAMGRRSVLTQAAGGSMLASNRRAVRRCIPREPVNTPPPPAWEIWSQQHGCGPAMLAMFAEVGTPYSTDAVDMPALLAVIALPEASYQPKCHSGDHRGCLQVSAQHRRSMRRMGLDYDSERDRLTWGCIIIRGKLDSGASLRSALRDWSTRDKAIRYYRQMTSSEVQE